MRIQELEVQLKDVRDHYIKKVRELHRKLEHYEHGGGGARDIALRDMEGVISHRDNAVMQQSRRAMDLQQQLVRFNTRFLHAAFTSVFLNAFECSS